MLTVWDHKRVIRREPCPYCRAGGGDKTGDNLVRYADEGAHCYACGRHEWPPKWNQLQEMSRNREMAVAVQTKLGFPRDATPLHEAIWAKDGIQWLKQYGISDLEIAKNRIHWSLSRNLLLFPVYDGNDELLMWQGRNFSNDGPKYLTEGPKHDILHLVGLPESGTIIVTEDVVSAIKVGRSYQAMPLWGADMALGLIKKVSARFSELGIWLDSNKQREAVKIALRASQYIPTFVVATPYDPKTYGYDAARERVEASRDEVYYKDDVENRKPKAVIQEAELDREPLVNRLKSAIAAVHNKRTVTGKDTPVQVFKEVNCLRCGFIGLNNRCSIGIDVCDNFPCLASRLQALIEKGKEGGNPHLDIRSGAEEDTRPKWPFATEADVVAAATDHSYNYRREASGS